MKFYISILSIPVILKVFPTTLSSLEILTREPLQRVYFREKKPGKSVRCVQKKKKNQKSQQIFCWARDSESFFKSHSMQNVRNAKTRKYLNNKHEAFSD